MFNEIIKSIIEKESTFLISRTISKSAKKISTSSKIQIISKSDMKELVEKNISSKLFRKRFRKMIDFSIENVIQNSTLFMTCETRNHAHNVQIKHEESITTRQLEEQKTSFKIFMIFQDESIVISSETIFTISNHSQDEKIDVTEKHHQQSRFQFTSYQSFTFFNIIFTYLEINRFQKRRRFSSIQSMTNFKRIYELLKHFHQTMKSIVTIENFRVKRLIKK